MADQVTENTSPVIARVGAIVLDVSDLARAERFWASVLNVEVANKNQQFVFFKPQPGTAGVTLQKVPEPKHGKNRAHADLQVEDIGRAISQIERLGGCLIRRMEEGGWQWAVMADTEGNEFCISR